MKFFVNLGTAMTNQGPADLNKEVEADHYTIDEHGVLHFHPPRPVGGQFQPLHGISNLCTFRSWNFVFTEDSVPAAIALAHKTN
jgi:hypothetical protein